MKTQLPVQCRWATALAAMILSASAVQAQAARDAAVYSGDAAARPASLRSRAPAESRILRSGDWSDPVLLASYPAFDFWSLDTAGGRDSQNLLQFAVRRWQYNDQNDNYDRYAIDHTGEVVGTWLDVPGLGEAAAFTDAADHSFSLVPVATTQNFAVADSDDDIHLFTTISVGGHWELYYSKIDSDGNTVIPWDIITQSADPWNFYVEPFVKSDDTVGAVWMRDTDDVCAVVSTDHGATWSDIIVLIERDDAVQGSCVKTVVGADDSIHLVWRTLDWNTYVENLWYAKIYPDWSVCVDETAFYEGACWYPYLSIDNSGSLHVTFGPIYDFGMVLMYTRLRGDLDLDGHPATDELLTEIPEEIFVSDTIPVRYPANVPDSAGNLHVIYERGQYGRETDKDVYYIRLSAGCPADFDGDGDVDSADLLHLLGAWGTPDGDVDGDGDTDTADLLALLGAWGDCP